MMEVLGHHGAGSWSICRQTGAPTSRRIQEVAALLTANYSQRGHSLSTERTYDTTAAQQVPMTTIAALSRRDAHITIGPVLPEDMGALYLWFNDVEAAKLDFPYVPVDGIAFKAWVEKQARNDGEYLFAIRKLQELPLIGYGLIRNVHPIHRSAEIGIRIGRETDRGKGYGASALRLLTDYVFDTLNLNRLSLSVRADNPRAIASYERAGFVQEGVLRQANYLNGALVDMTIMAILKSEWRPSTLQTAAVPCPH